MKHTKKNNPVATDAAGIISANEIRMEKEKLTPKILTMKRFFQLNKPSFKLKMKTQERPVVKIPLFLSLDKRWWINEETLLALGYNYDDAEDLYSLGFSLYSEDEGTFYYQLNVIAAVIESFTSNLLIQI